MRKYRILRYGLFEHIFDVEIKMWYGWVEPVIGRRWKISFCDFNVPVEDSDWIENMVNKGEGYPVFDTYEEALETGLQKSLELIIQL